MIWFHCNYCGVQPSEVEGGIEMFVTSCSHTFCKACVDYIVEHKRCVKCDKHPVQSVKVAAGMNAQVRGMFGNVTGSVKLAIRVLGFQAKQEDILDLLLKKSLSETAKEKLDLEEQIADLKKKDSNEDDRLKSLLKDQDELSEELRRLEEEARACDDATPPKSPPTIAEEAASPSGGGNDVSVISYNTTVGDIFQAIKTPDCIKLQKKSLEARKEVHEDGKQSLKVDLPKPQGSKMAAGHQQQLPASATVNRAAAPQLPTAFSPIRRSTQAPISTKPSAAAAKHTGPIQVQNPKPFAKPVLAPIPKPAPVVNRQQPMTSTPISLDQPSNPKSTMPRPPILINKFPFLK